MPDQDAHTATAHTPVSNQSTELTEGTVVEQEQVSQPPFEGKGFQGLQEERAQDEQIEG